MKENEGTPCSPSTILAISKSTVNTGDKGLFKKKCQLSCSFVFCLSLLLFHSDKVHKQ